jgi:uncharacterized protein YjbJ (UPF0337 family)
MGLFDKAKGLAGDLRDRAGDLADEHGDKIKQGIDKAADVADDKTRGKRRGTITSAADKAKGAVDKLAEGKGRPRP